jgi:hypothetical protein
MGSTPVRTAGTVISGIALILIVGILGRTAFKTFTKN